MFASGSFPGCIEKASLLKRSVVHRAMPRIGCMYFPGIREKSVRHKDGNFAYRHTASPVRDVSRHSVWTACPVEEVSGDLWNCVRYHKDRYRLGFPVFTLQEVSFNTL